MKLFFQTDILCLSILNTESWEKILLKPSLFIVFIMSHQQCTTYISITFFDYFIKYVRKSKGIEPGCSLVTKKHHLDKSIWRNHRIYCGLVCSIFASSNQVCNYILLLPLEVSVHVRMYVQKKAKKTMVFRRPLQYFVYIILIGSAVSRVQVCTRQSLLPWLQF